MPPRTGPGASRRRQPSGGPAPEPSPGERPRWRDGDPGDAGPGQGGPTSAGADLHTRARRRLARRGQRYTPGRRALVTALAAARRPVAVADLLVVERSLAASSAYRNLGVLQEAGVVRRVPGTDDHDRFELSEELSGHHHHVVCSNCGAMVDVTPAPRLEQVLAQAVRLAEEETGFAVDEHRIELVGRCRSCQGRRHPAGGHRRDQ